MELRKGQRVRVTLEAEVINPVPDSDEKVPVYMFFTGSNEYVPVESIEPAPNEFRVGQVWSDDSDARYLVWDVRDGYAYAVNILNRDVRRSTEDTNLNLLLDTE